MNKIEYKGWKNNLCLTNGEVELIVTLDVGPCVISFRHTDGPNVLKEFAEHLGKSGGKEWVGRGGHRLWIGPEDLTRTYAPDNAAVDFKIDPSNRGRVRFTPVAQTDECVQKYGLRKEIEIELAPQGSGVKLIHHLTNVGKEPAELAPWVLTVMEAGGLEVIPLPAKRPHPGPPANAKSPRDYAANITMALWPYFDFKDPRWTFGSRFITLGTDNERGPTKIGLSHQLGWVGYLNQGTLFVKRFGYDETKIYPDNGMNLETFTSKDMLEIESLGPLTKLGPGECVQHVEEWELHKDVPPCKVEADIEKNIVPRVQRK
jgi:hypothetical protein